MIWILGSIGLIGAIFFFRWQNNDIVVSEYEHENDKIPGAFDGYRIVHLSDLHNKRFSKGQLKLLQAVRRAKPHMIVITGDLIDKRRPGLSAATELIRGLMRYAPVYFVPGNHEKTSREYKALKAILMDAGVVVLENRVAILERDEETINLLGMKDFFFYRTKRGKAADKESYYKRLLRVAPNADAGFCILLAHRPELIDIYERAGADLVFSGHAHGGQVRLPVIGGLFAPGQGLFPRYTSGLNPYRSAMLVVSRGLGNSSFPLRCFNRPEVIVLTLKNGAQKRDAYETDFS